MRFSISAFSVITSGSFSYQAYMLKYDSTHGVFKGTIKVLDESTLDINGKQVKVSSTRYCPEFPSSVLVFSYNAMAPRI